MDVWREAGRQKGKAGGKGHDPSAIQQKLCQRDLPPGLVATLQSALFILNKQHRFFNDSSLSHTAKYNYIMFLGNFLVVTERKKGKRYISSFPEYLQPFNYNSEMRFSLFFFFFLNCVHVLLSFLRLYAPPWYVSF